MRIVIDTNVLVSAAIKDKDPEAVILCVVSRPDIEWIASPNNSKSSCAIDKKATHR